MRWSQIRNSCQKSFIAAGRKNNNAQSYVRLHLVPMINVGTWKTSTCFSLGVGGTEKRFLRGPSGPRLFLYIPEEKLARISQITIFCPNTEKQPSCYIHSWIFNLETTLFFFSVDRMCTGCLRETKEPLVDVINCSPPSPELAVSPSILPAASVADAPIMASDGSVSRSRGHLAISLWLAR